MAAHGTDHGSAYSNDSIADELDNLARSAHRIRRMIPGMTVTQLTTISEACPLSETDPTLSLLDLDTWAVVAAASLREGISLSIDRVS